MTFTKSCRDQGSMPRSGQQGWCSFYSGQLLYKLFWTSSLLSRFSNCRLNTIFGRADNLWFSLLNDSTLVLGALLHHRLTIELYIGVGFLKQIRLWHIGLNVGCALIKLDITFTPMVWLFSITLEVIIIFKKTCGRNFCVGFGGPSSSQLSYVLYIYRFTLRPAFY